MSIVLCHPVRGTLSQQPQEKNTPAWAPWALPLTVVALLGHHNHVRLLQSQLVVLPGLVGSEALHLRGVLEENSGRTG